MTLTTFLKSLEPGTIVHLGTRGGAQWIDIGPAEEMLDNLIWLNEKLLAHMRRSKANSKKHPLYKKTPEYYDRPIEKFVPLGRRKVCETYDKTIEPFGVAVMVTGDERGTYWFYEEKLNDLAKKSQAIMET